ncbi:MAG: hypothetical protein VKN60_02040, partial [Cyanobacteriota bacterium]|nr:hypothetical protein [Cyanobacteriota bacterium]
GAPLALNNAGEAYVVFGSKNAYQNLRPGQNVFSLDPTLTDTRDDDQAQTFNLSAAEGDLFLLDSLTFGALSFQGNQISLGAELLAIVVDYTGNPVTDLGANPQWFVSI